VLIQHVLVINGLSTLRPWDTCNWDLDPKFLDDIARWTGNHPDDRFDRVLDSICTAIDIGKDLIPNNPVPARDLVQALSGSIDQSRGFTIDLRCHKTC